MSSLPNYIVTAEEYLDLERSAHDKSEYIDGRILAMAGGSERHNRLVANLIIALGSQLRGRSCRVYPSDLKVWIPRGPRYFYPDVTVICGPAEFFDEREDVVTNPVLLVEVISDGTAAMDRGLKLQSYTQIPTLQDYLLVSQESPRIERYARGEGGPWLYTEHTEREARINLAAIGCVLTLSDVFDAET